MHRLTGIALASVLLLLTACLPTQSQQVMERDLAEMKRRLAEIERRTAGAGPDGMVGIQDRFAELGRRQAETQAGLDALRVEFQALQGRLADMDHRLQQEGEELALVRDDLTLRFTALEDRLMAVPRTPAAASTEAGASAESLYQAGLEKVRAGNDLAGARRDFRSFMERYPKHALAVNAQYWLGETYYGEKAYENAVLQFQEVIDSYPGHPKVASALLKQALAFEALGDKKSARLRLEQVVREFPKSPEAAKARAYLK